MTVAIASPYRYSHTVGLLSQAGRGFNNPVDLAIGGSGRLYVLSRSNMTHAPLGILRVSICTVDEEYIGQFATFGTGDGQIVWPTSIAVDSRENVYVSDEHRHDVQAFDRDGVFMRKWGSFGNGIGQLNRPSGLAVDHDDNVVVVDHLNSRVQRFSPKGEPLATWGTAGTGLGEFNLPWGVAVDARGQIYVADWRNDRVQKFDEEGRYLASFGSPGSGEGQLKRPAGVGVGSDGRVYVADWGNHRVQVFTSDGGHLATLLGDGSMSKWAAQFVAADPEMTELRRVHAEAVRTQEKLFRAPTAVAIDERGRVLVVDSTRHRIQVYQAIDG